MARPHAATAALAALLAACGGLDAPDLTTGAVAGRVEPAFPEARAYVLGRPELRTTPAPDGLFVLERVPVGPLEVVVFDGGARAGRLPATVRGAEVTWVGPAAPRPGDLAGEDGAPFPPPGSGSGGAGGGGLPLAGAIEATASSGGVPLAAARFTVAGTEWVDVPAGGAGASLLGALPPGTYELVARADGFAEARQAVQVAEGATIAVGLTLEPAAP